MVTLLRKAYLSVLLLFPVLVGADVTKQLEQKSPQVEAIVDNVSSFLSAEQASLQQSLKENGYPIEEVKEYIFARMTPSNFFTYVFMPILNFNPVFTEDFEHKTMVNYMGKWAICILPIEGGLQNVTISAKPLSEWPRAIATAIISNAILTKSKEYVSEKFGVAWLSEDASKSPQKGNLVGEVVRDMSWYAASSAVGSTIVSPLLSLTGL